MSNHQNIEELFRSKLGEAEITPSKRAWKGVQRKLRMKKFLRFDASRFNIWYAGALLVAGTTAVALLNNTPGESLMGEERDVRVVEEIRETNSGSGSREEKREVKRTSKQSTEAGTNKEERKRREPGTDKPAAHKESLAEVNEQETMIEERLEVPDSTPTRQSLVAHFTASETIGCAPLMVEFCNSSVGASTTSWNFGNGEVSEESDPDYIFEKAGIYAVALNATGAAGDTGVFYQVIRVYPAPVAGFEMEEGLQQLDGTISLELMNYSTGGYSYSWDMLSARGRKLDGWSSNEFQPTFNNSEIPEEARQIRMVVLNEHGCTDTAFAKIITLGSAQRTMAFPTVFSGNPTGPTGGYYNPNDLRLDVFHPHYSEQPAEYHLRVYSKMGEIIFETQDILQGWDGYYMQEGTASGVYLWVATGTWQNGTAFNLRGDVTLLWNDRR